MENNATNERLENLIKSVDGLIKEFKKFVSSYNQNEINREHIISTMQAVQESIKKDMGERARYTDLQNLRELIDTKASITHQYITWAIMTAIGVGSIIAAYTV